MSLTKKDLMLRLVGNAFAPHYVDKFVNIENGTILGRCEPLHMCVEWFAIPYAAPARGELRWRKPMPAPPIEGILDCRKPAPEQMLQCFGSKTFGAEGGLTLNVIRGDSPDKDLPVIVYFHGGNLQVGNAQEWLGNKFTMERSAVCVSVEYRLGSFAFNNLPCLKTGDAEEDSGNFALLDAKAALEWVKRNIESFGGNPDNITICGHSGGGRLVTLMMISPLFKDKGLFHRAILFNSPAITCESDNGRLVFAHRYAKLALEDGLFISEEEAVEWLLSEKETDMSAVKEWLYELDGVRVINLFPLAGVRMHLFPQCFTDGKVLPKEGFKAELINQVPVLIFSSPDEFSSFASVDPYFRKRLKENPDDSALKKQLNVCRELGSKLYAYQNGHWYGDNFFGRIKQPIYIGSLAYGTHEGGVDKSFVEQFGAVHGNVLPFLTDQCKIPWKRGNDFFTHLGAIRLGEVFLACIYSFMVSGNPNCDELELKWHSWTPEHQQAVCFDADREQYEIYEQINDFSYEKLFDEFDADTSLSKEAKKDIVTKVLAYRWFSTELDLRYGNKSPWYER